MQSVPAYHDPRGHMSAMAARRIGRNNLPRPGGSRRIQGNLESGLTNNNNTATTGEAVHSLQFTAQGSSTTARGAEGALTISHHTTDVSSGTQVYTLYGSGAPTVATTHSYDFGSSSTGGSGMSAIPDPDLGLTNKTDSNTSLNKIRIPASALRALTMPTSRPLETSNNSNSDSCSSSPVSKPSISNSSRERGVIRTTLSSTGNVSGTPSKGKGSSGKNVQHQQQQPKDRQSFHASLIELFARDKKALLCPKCHQEGNIHRDGISEGKMRFTCNTMVPTPIGRRRKCNKHFYERAMHSMLVEIVHRKQHLRLQQQQQQQQHHGDLVIAAAAAIVVAEGDMSDVDGGELHSDMSSASPELAPWSHALLAAGGGSTF
ncbi:hypothetical protein EC991_008532 [Linnemannia zychae]|nr:hypothetical protein EC991_008532 [Linnemannia zychae]